MQMTKCATNEEFWAEKEYYSGSDEDDPLLTQDEKKQYPILSLESMSPLTWFYALLCGFCVTTPPRYQRVKRNNVDISEEDCGGVSHS